MACNGVRARGRIDRPVNAASLFRLWVGIGVKSVGGGQAVQYYAFETLVNERKWLTYDGWAQSWALSQVVPGVNVIAACGLTGLRIAGIAGAAASLLGLMMPSVIATVAIAAVYAQVAHVPGVAAALHGMFIAVAGTTVVLNWRVGRPVVDAAAARATPLAIATVLIPIVAGIIVYAGWVPVFVVLLGAAAVLGVGWSVTSVRHD